MNDNFTVLTEDSQFQAELTKHGSKLIVVDFTSERCGPCQSVAPIFEELSIQYPNAIFLKVDIQVCPGAASSQSVTATPTFILYRNKVKLDLVRGTDMKSLDSKLKQFYGDGSSDSADCGVPGHMDLITMVNKNGCECLNEADDHTFQNVFSPSATFLESDADEQLIFYINFNQGIKLHSLRIRAPSENGPKNVKLFINQPYTLDFDSAESGIAVQEFALTPKDLTNELIPLKYVRFQNVLNLTIFVHDNQSGSEVTRIDYLQLIGSPIHTTNMSDFKRISGKEGEAE